MDMSKLKREWNSRKHESKTCFQLLCFLAISLSVVSQECVEIYPTSDVYVEIGKPAELLCVTNGNFSSDHLEFTRQGKHVESAKVNDTAIQLVSIPSNLPSENYRVAYSCKSKYANCPGNTVRPVYSALPPREIIDFQCISENFESLYCSWISPDNISTQYNVSYSDYRGSYVVQTAQAVNKTKRKYCLWSVNTIPAYRRDAKEFTFYINSTNELGFATEIKNLTDHFSIVKPAAVMNLSTVNVSSHHIKLQWEVHNNLVLEYFGEYEYKIVCDLIIKTNRSKHINTLQHYSHNLSKHNKVVTFNLTDLPYAHMQYKVRVYMKPDRASEKFWSEPSEIHIYTSSEVPRKPPDVASGSFHQVTFEKDRQIQLYWKELEENEQAGSNFSYSICIKHGECYKKTGGSLRLDHAAKEDIEISIWAENEIGKSINGSYIFIPFGSTPQVSSLTKHTYINGTNKLSWIGLDNVDNYTVFWCPYIIKNDCTDRINYTVIGAHENHFIITLPRDTVYQFAISANYRNATHGMTWTKCTTHEDLPLSDFNVKFKDYSNLTETSVKLYWSLNCILEEGYLHRYIISYCPKAIPSSDCKGNYEYINNIEQHIHIHGLKPYTAYAFTIKLDTVYGIKSINETNNIFTLAGTPTTPSIINISAVLNDSLVIDLDPTYPLNGDKGNIRYDIFNVTRKLESFFHTPITLSNLNSFTNYSLSIRACNVNINKCSNKTDNIFVRTRIGPPARVGTPTYEFIEGNKFLFKWKEPKIRGGNVDLYEIKIKKGPKEKVFNVEKRHNAEFEPCDEGVDNVGFQVRAVNNDSDAHYGALSDSDKVFLPKRDRGVFMLFHGEWSEERPVLCQRPADLTALYCIALISGTLILGYLLRKYHLLIKAKKDIYPVFAQGLLPSNVIPPITVNENRTILNKLWLLLCQRSQITVNQQTYVDSSKPLISQDNVVKEHIITKIPLTIYSTDSLSINQNTQATCEDVDACLKINLQQSPDSSTKTDVISSKKTEINNLEKIKLHSKGKETIEPEITNKADSSLRNKFEVSKPLVNPKTGYVPSSFTKPSNNSKPVVNIQTGYVQTGIVPKVNVSLPAVSPASKHSKGYVKADTIALNERNKPKVNLGTVSGRNSSTDVPNANPTVSSYVRIGLPENNSKIPTKNETETKQKTGYIRPELLTKQEISKTKGAQRNIPKEHDWPSESVEMKLEFITEKVRDKQIENKPIKSESGYVKPEDVINKQLNILSRGNDTQVTSQEGYCRLSLDRFNND